MFDATIIEVALGLIFVFLLVGLGTTAIQEGIASRLNWRAKVLKIGIKHMVCEEDEKDAKLTNLIYQHPLIKTISSTKFSICSNRKPLARRIPSYIPARIFFAALADIEKTSQCTYVKGKIEILNQKLETFIGTHANTNTQRLTITPPGDRYFSFLELWYNMNMERISGWYKRRAQLFSLSISLVIAVAFNINAIDVVQSIWSTAENDARLELLVSVASNSDTSKNLDDQWVRSVTGCTDTLDGTFDACIKEKTSTPMPIGWRFGESSDDGCRGLLGWTLLIFGWLITAVAGSLGAPFWFGLLDQVANVRSTGEPIDTPTQQPPPSNR